MRVKTGMAMLLAVLPAMAAAEGIGGYVGAGLGVPAVAYGSSGLAVKIFGGYKVHEFAIPKAGAVQLAVRAMVEFYPNGYQVAGVSGVFHF